MKTISRWMPVFVAILLAAPMALAAECCAKEEKAPACSGGACSVKKPACPHGKCDMKHAGCSHEGGCCGATQFASAADVHWANKGVSFGNYLKLAKAELPAPPSCPPAFEPIYFDLDKAKLRKESVAEIAKLAEYLKANPDKTVLVEGNCCDLGTNAYNKKLGAKRAAAVKKYLVDSGVEAKRIKTVSYGEEKLKYGADKRELNRRDDFVVRCGDSKK